MGNGFAEVPYAMGPRIPGLGARDLGDSATSTFNFETASRTIVARAAQTQDCSDPRACETPVGSSGMTAAIALGVW
jgi:hypothetical protein